VSRDEGTTFCRETTVVGPWEGLKGGGGRERRQEGVSVCDKG
jgi:hypothetical protein